MKKYTDEMIQFLADYTPGHHHREIADAFNQKFNTNLSVKAIGAALKRYHFYTGFTGQFPKGHVPVNKGKKGVCAPGCEKTWFKKGRPSLNERPVGSERVNVDGYIELKVAKHKWKLKHRVVWEEANGPIPRGSILIFLDNNKLNTELSNLMLLPRKISCRLNQQGFGQLEPEAKIAAIKLVEYQYQVIGIKKSRKKGEHAKRQSANKGTVEASKKAD